MPSSTRLLVWVAIIVPLMMNTAHARQAYTSSDPEWKVEVIDEEWVDPTRSESTADAAPGSAGRKVPVRVYLPAELAATGAQRKTGENSKTASTPVKHPVVVFSHGLGGTRDGYEYIGRALASRGYLVIHPQHAGSDRQAMVEAAREKLVDGKKKNDADKGKGKDAKTKKRSLLGLDMIEEGTSDAGNLENRPKDISFVLDKLGKHERFAKYADMSKVAAAGHSFGSYTTMAVAGMLVDLPGRPDQSFRDARVIAGIAMSPQGPGVMGVDDKSWGPIAIPMLIVTGTNDMGQGDRAASWRHEPYKRLRLADKYFLNITDANHMTFADAGLRTKVSAAEHEKHISYVKQTCLAFLDAYLNGDAEAKRWLQEKSIVKAAGGKCELQYEAGKGAETK